MRNILLLKRSFLIIYLLSMYATSFAQVTEKWVKRYNGDANAGDQASRLVIDRKGNVIVTGFSFGVGTGADYATIKYDDDGEEEWVQRYNGPGNSSDGAEDIATDHKGNVYVTGASFNADNTAESEIATIKYDADGNTEWIQRFNEPGQDLGNAITVDKKGNVYITGFSTGNMLTIKYDKNGDTVWVRTYNGPGNGFDRASNIAVDKDGSVYVTGSSTGIGTGEDITTIKYDDDGNLQWVQRYNGLNNSFDGANALALDSRGNVYVTGSVDQGNGNFTDIVTIKYNAAGQQQWVATFNRNPFESGTAIKVDDDGNVYITGLTGTGTSDPDNDYVTIKYNSAGMQQWVAVFVSPGVGEGAATDLVLDGTGNVYITGGNAIESGLDYATIKYNTNGEQQWVAIYEGPGSGNDVATGIGLDKKGNVYVTGRSDGNGTGPDYATIKYEQTPLITARSATNPQQINPVVAEPGAIKLNAKAFPNAFTEFINLQWNGSDKPVTITITDVLGRQVEKRTGLASSGTIQTGYQLKAGVYFAEIVQGPEKVILKLVKY